MSSAKKGGSNGKMVTLSRLGIFLPPICLRLKVFELQNIMVRFIKMYMTILKEGVAAVN